MSSRSTKIDPEHRLRHAYRVMRPGLLIFVPSVIISFVPYIFIFTLLPLYIGAFLALFALVVREEIPWLIKLRASLIAILPSSLLAAYLVG